MPGKGLIRQSLRDLSKAELSLLGAIPPHQGGTYPRILLVQVPEHVPFSQGCQRAAKWSSVFAGAADPPPRPRAVDQPTGTATYCTPVSRRSLDRLPTGRLWPLPE